MITKTLSNRMNCIILVSLLLLLYFNFDIYRSYQNHMLCINSIVSCSYKLYMKERIID